MPVKDDKQRCWQNSNQNHFNNYIKKQQFSKEIKKNYQNYTLLIKR